MLICHTWGRVVIGGHRPMGLGQAGVRCQSRAAVTGHSKLRGCLVFLSLFHSSQWVTAGCRSRWWIGKRANAFAKKKKGLLEPCLLACLLGWLSVAGLISPPFPPRLCCCSSRAELQGAEWVKEAQRQSVRRRVTMERPSRPSLKVTWTQTPAERERKKQTSLCPTH